MISAVVFDIGDVVCAFEPQLRLEALAACTGLEPARIHAAIWESGLDARADVGRITPIELERELLEALEGRIDAGALRAAWSAAFVPDPEVGAIVRRVDRPVLAFTNNGPMLTECLAHELGAVGALFDRVVYSWQVEALKNEPVAFERLCRDIGLRADELLLVDDSVTNTAVARSVGLDALTFTSAARLEVELGERHVLRAH